MSDTKITIVDYPKLLAEARKCAEYFAYDQGMLEELPWFKKCEACDGAGRIGVPYPGSGFGQRCPACKGERAVRK